MRAGHTLILEMVVTGWIAHGGGWSTPKGRAQALIREKTTSRFLWNEECSGNIRSWLG